MKHYVNVNEDAEPYGTHVTRQAAEDSGAEFPNDTVVEVDDTKLIERVASVLALSPASHATKSRDYGRGFAEALRIVQSILRQETP